MWPIGVGRVSLTIQSRRTAPRRSARTANCGGPSSSGSRSTASTWRSLSPTWESSPTEVNRNYFPSQAQMLWPSWMLPVTKLQMRKTLEFIRIGNMLIWVAFSITLFHSKLLFFCLRWALSGWNMFLLAGYWSCMHLKRKTIRLYSGLKKRTIDLKKHFMT